MRRLAPVLLALAALASRASHAQSAQSAVWVSGVVTDSSGIPIAGAEVEALGSAVRVRTGASGAFRIDGIVAGPASIVARRLGFRPETLAVLVVTNGEPIAFTLRTAPAMLETVAVTVGRRFTGRLAGYYERLAARTQGYFITRDDIDRGNPRQLTDVLRRAPGVEIVRGSRVRLRGRNCAPLVWIDGVSMPAGEVELNTFAPSSLEGIEIYMTASGAPGRYQGTGDESKCGTVLLWSRGGDTEERRAPVSAATSNGEQLRAAAGVFTAAEVDSGARPVESTSWSIVYPPDLLAARIGGVVVAEFVVDTAGRVEPESFGIVTSPHPVFSHAVFDAVRAAVFVPARRSDRPVRQLLQMRFRFAPPGGER
jgi:TonB family protein